MSIYALVGLTVSFSLGRLVDRIGALAPLLCAAFLFAVGSFVTLLWPENGLIVLIGRGLEGLGFAVAAIVGPVMANAHASPRHLPIVAGFTATWIPVGQLAATFAAPLVLEDWGWQGLWWLAIMGSLGFAAWTILLNRGNAEIFAQLPQSRRGPSQSTAGQASLSLRQTIALVATAAIFMLWSSQYFAYMTWLPQYLVEEHGLGMEGALIGYVVPVTLVLISCIAAGILVRFGVPLPMLLLISLVIQAACWWVLPWVRSPEAGIPALVVYGATAGLVPGCLFAMPSAVLRSGARTARAFGIVMTGRNLGVLTGPVLLAWAFEWSGGWAIASPLFGMITTLCLPLAAGLAYLLKPSDGGPKPDHGAAG